MIGDLLDVSRIETRRLAVEPHPVDLEELLPRIVKRFKTASEDHPVGIRLGDSDLPICADPARFEQIVVNLLTNAVKYSFPGTPITVAARRERATALVSVANQGPGIPSDEIPKIFGRFYRSQRAREGSISGLGRGLYITKRLVEAQGRKVWFESVPDDTTTFYVALPLQAETPAGDSDRSR